VILTNGKYEGVPVMEMEVFYFQIVSYKVKGISDQKYLK
jgi:hypothetical protein